MKLKDLIQSTNWLSIKLTLLELYPDIKSVIEEYKNIYKKIKLMESKSYKMEIVLTECEDNYDNETTTYIDVFGRKTDEIKSESYALEFTKWNKWLGMELANETINNFTKLEIIAHCLYEMTFIDYDENKIQEQLYNINNIANEHKNLTDQEKKDKNISLE